MGVRREEKVGREEGRRGAYLIGSCGGFVGEVESSCYADLVWKVK